MLPQNICRLCLKPTPFALPLHTNNSLRMLEILTCIKVDPEDVFTSSCLKCLLNLKLAFNIQQNIIKSDRTLHQIGESAVLNSYDVVTTEDFVIKEESNLADDDNDGDFESAEMVKIEPQSSTKLGNSTLEAPKPVTQRRSVPYQERTLKKQQKIAKQSPAPHQVFGRKACPICKKEISTNTYKRHVRNHGTGPQICEHCGTTCESLDSLRFHLIYKHRTQYQCTICNLRFKNMRALTTHRIKVHTGRRHMCDTCGRKFFFAYDLSKHTKISHLKMRPYVCEYCQKGFSGRYALNTHKRQHTMETPFKCDVCAAGFRQKVSLKAHLKSKHNIMEPITCFCKVCGKGFASEFATKSHMKLHC